MMKSELNTRTLKALSDAYLAQELRANPDYQRGLQWSVGQQQGLIDSLLRGYQIPIFYIHLESRTNNYTRAVETTAWIVDGQQRLAAIVSFCQNEFALADPRKARTGTVLPVADTEVPVWAGKKFQDLNAEDKTRLLEHELLVVEITAEKNEVRDLFIRLQAGTPLTAQEKRDAWPGDFTEFVIKHAGKPGHRLSNPKAFFNQFKKVNSRRLSVADGEHYVDGHADMRKFFAGLAMTVILRERAEIDFVDLKGKTINEFYLANLDLSDDDPGALRVTNLLDLIAQLPSFSRLREGSPMTFQMAFHFALLIDSLNEGSYAPSWRNGVVDAFLAFKSEVAEARARRREALEPVPYYDRFARLLSGSGSDTAEVIRLRHGFMLSEVYPKLQVIPLDPQRLFDSLEREVIWNRDRGQCQSPGHPGPDRRVPFSQARIHHIVEHTAGGGTTLKNGVLICPTCHADRARMQELQPHFLDYIAKVYSGSALSAADLPAEDTDSEAATEANGGGEGRLKITVNWGTLDVDRPAQVIYEQSDAATIVEFLRALILEFGDRLKQQLKEIPIVRYPLSDNPGAAFLNRATNRPYSFIQVPGTNLYFCPQSSRSQKVERLKALVSRLTLPDGGEFPGDSIKIGLDGISE